MKPYLHLVLLSTLWLVAPLSAASNSAPETFGNSVGEGETVPIAEILADPEGFEGKEVRIEGTVSDVCPKKGCWMELRDAEDQALRVKVEDDVVVFPKESVGKTAVAVGKIRLIPLDREGYIGWMRHLAEEKGETFDGSSVGEGPFRIVQLDGSGARIGG